MRSRITRVLALSGPSGAGKTTAFESLTSSSFHGMDAKYSTSNQHKISSNQLLSKWMFLGYWFKEAYNLHIDGVTGFLSDRSPLDSCAYLNHGADLVRDLTLRSFQELEAEKGVKVDHIYMTASISTLRERARQRDLQFGAEPHRLSEKSGALESSIAFYDSNASLFSRKIDTTNMSIEVVAQTCRKMATEIFSEDL